MKKMLIAGNWKMNKNMNQTLQFIDKLTLLLNNKEFKSEILICPPFTSIYNASHIEKNEQIKVGAQNCYYEERGAFTGEVSIEMIKDSGCEYIIIGHSERRAIFKETDELINKKALAILKHNLKPILCIGETLEERQSGKTEEVIKYQLENSLKGIEDVSISGVVIAYEPVWAIGTGISASLEQIDSAHNYIRNLLKEYFPKNYNKVLIQYGGSVNKSNCEEIFKIENVNGALIGGASLVAEDFYYIIEKSEQIINQ